MNALVLTGGDYPDKETIFSYTHPDLIIAADSGLDTAEKLNIECDLIIGDLDSVSRTSLKKYAEEKIIQYPEDKDYSDTELAIIKAREMGCTHITIAGGGGGRMDHLFAIKSLFDRQTSPDLWITDNCVVILIKERYTIMGASNKILSFFPVGTEVCRMTSIGLKWPLDDLEWKTGDCGISNVALKNEVKIEMISGKLICVFQLFVSTKEKQ